MGKSRYNRAEILQGMHSMKITPVVMAGGSGTRLWPLSRARYPKQFLRLNSAHSLLQETLLRTDGIDCADAVLICNEEHRFLVAEQLREIQADTARIILEPAGRNTAPAIALAALDVLARADDGLLLVMAADHVIEDTPAFERAVADATVLAKQGKLATFGIVPTHPETGYGYIKAGEAVADCGAVVEQFVEKPDKPTAEAYLASGDYFWNSGMFLFSAKHYLAALAQFAPQIHQACELAYQQRVSDLDFIRVDAQAFKASPSDSVDYAIMEHTQDAAMVPLDAGWSDVGSWSALWDIDDKDKRGNAFHGDVVTHNTKNTLIHGGHRLIATVGVDNMVIVDTKDALLVAAKDQVQDIKKILQPLDGRNELIDHREVYRPWGRADAIDQGERFVVRNVTIKPGARIAKQMHYHRAEHWVVVSGTAKIQLGEDSQVLTENQSTYIPVGVAHSIENVGKVDLKVIEVHSGGYLSEDDVVRFEEQYQQKDADA